MAATLCKSAMRVASRTLANRSKSFTTKSSTPFLFSSPSSSTNIPRASRVLSAMGSFESLMPLHNAVANARLTSNIALDSTFWSMLSQGLLDPFKMKEKNVTERIIGFFSDSPSVGE